MNTIFASFIGGWEMILILAVVLILFGAKKLPELAKGLGQGIKEFKKASREVTEELHRPQGKTVTPEAFDVASACHIMGDISRTTLYRLLLRGKLERLPATRKVLVTRRSIERFCSQAA